MTKAARLLFKGSRTAWNTGSTSGRGYPLTGHFPERAVLDSRLSMGPGSPWVLTSPEWRMFMITVGACRAVQRMGTSPSAQRRIGRQERLAPTADLCVSRQGASIMIHRIISTLTVFVALNAFAYWPPIVESKHDIEALPDSTTRLRARGLHDSDIPALSHLPLLKHLDFGEGRKARVGSISDK